jgi:regulatory protein
MPVGREPAAGADAASAPTLSRSGICGGTADRCARRALPGVGLLDDAAYATARVHSLHRRGESLRAMRARLAAKGVPAADVADAVSGLRATTPDPDLAAACAFARRRRLGPFRRSAADLPRELGAFARAGFSRRVAEAVLACPDVAAVEALARGEPD